MGTMRHLKFITVSFLFLLSLLAFTPVAPASETDVLEMLEARERVVADQMEACTLYVLVDDGESYSMGTAFVVADGYALTNAHVVESDGSILVMNTKQKPARAEIVDIDYGGGAGEGNDFALLRYTPTTKLPVVTFSMRVGRMDRVSAWGFPAMVTQFDQSIDDILEGKLKKTPPVVYTEGTVSTIVEKNGEKTIIHSAAIAGGNSGGPLVNVRGEVVGINTWGYTEEDEGAFVNASLPSERIVAFLSDCGIRARIDRQLPGTAQVPAASPSPSIDTGGPTMVTKKPSSPNPEEGDAAELLKLAKNGNSDAQAAVGAMYYDGDGLPKDTGEAVKWLQKAIQGGCHDAKALLGVIFLFEEDYSDPDKGVLLLKEASAAPDADGEIQGLLARILYEGEVLGVPRDESECFKWADKAAKQGDPDGMAMLAMLYYFGEGVEENDKKALELVESAVKKDSSFGKAVLAWMYYDGVAVEEDLEKALALATDAAEQEESSAQGLLAIMYLNGYGVNRNPETAEGWARRASEQCNEFGWFVLGSLYMDGVEVEKDLPMAWAYMDLANSKNVADSDELLKKLTKEMSSNDLKKGKEIQSRWFKEWGLSRR